MLLGTKAFVHDVDSMLSAVVRDLQPRRSPERMLDKQACCAGVRDRAAVTNSR